MVNKAERLPMYHVVSLLRNHGIHSKQRADNGKKEDRSFPNGIRTRRWREGTTRSERGMKKDYLILHPCTDPLEKSNRDLLQTCMTKR